jgi:nucleoside-diphosphate-sugar epimerase
LGVGQGTLESLVRLPNASFWRGKRVLLTGHSGFKGSWLTIWLQRLGAHVIGVSLPPNTEPNLFTMVGIQGICQSHFCDIRDGYELATLIREVEPQLVFHLAAQPLVRASYRDAFLAPQGVSIASARAGNVIGGGDWSEDRLIPDAVRAWQAEEVLKIRRPNAVRPWQHVLDPLAGYLALAEQLWERPADMGAYNFGPEAHSAASVKDVIELARGVFRSCRVNYAESDEGPHEAGLLVLDTEKAKKNLGVNPRWRLSEAVKKTMAWYRAQLDGANANQLCLADIAAFEGKT